MSSWMRAAHAVLASLQVIAGAAGLGEMIGARWAGLIVLVVGALQAGMVVYEQGLVTPVPGTVAPTSGTPAESLPEWNAPYVPPKP